LIVDLPHDIDELIMQMLSKDPSQRPADGSILLKRLESIRGKLVRKHNLTDTAFRGPTRKSENSGGTRRSEDAPVTDNPPPPSGLPTYIRATVLFIGLLICLGGIIYAFVKPRQTAEELFAKAEPLMNSNDPAQWDKAWKDYLEPLTLRYPDNAHKGEIDQFRQMMEDAAMQHRLLGRNRNGAKLSEAQRFYNLGANKLQSGDTDGARKTWKSLAQSFADVPSERRWVLLAQRALAESEPGIPDQDRFNAAKEALVAARAHRTAGRRDQAELIWHGLEELYANDPAAKALLETIQKDRLQKDE